MSQTDRRTDVFRVLSSISIYFSRISGSRIALKRRIASYILLAFDQI